MLFRSTNHLDVDSREALVQALNDYSGAVVIVSHDRHMIELVADRLVLVDGGRAEEFSGTLEDYTDFVLGKGGQGDAASSGGASKGDRKADKRAAAQAREQSKALRAAVTAAEKEMATLTTERSKIERAMFDPASADPSVRDLPMSELSRRHGKVVAQLEAAEAKWMEAVEALEETAAV